MSCGACCAYYRVIFYWREIESVPEQYQVPEKLSTDCGPFARAMLGTVEKKPRCKALYGEVGTQVACSVYENRPSPCRDFKASFSDGQHNPRCDEARARHGLRPLKAQDFHGLEKLFESPNPQT